MAKESFSNGVCEAILTEHPTFDLTVATVYRPPDTTQDEFQELLAFLKTHLSNIPHIHLVITGDLNFPQDVVIWHHMPPNMESYQSQNHATRHPRNCNFRSSYNSQTTCNLSSVPLRSLRDY